jgi:hypothetical protein
MCFSAGASFASGTVLSAIGLAAVKRANNSSVRLFAGIPLLFAFQQFSEGFLWLTLKNGGSYMLQSAATFFFLIMALVVWPTLIPLSVLKMEQNQLRRKVITWFLSAGFMLSLYYSWNLLTKQVTPVINHFHIQYLNNFPVLSGYFAFGVYVLVTIGSLFASGLRRMWIFGLLIFISCTVTGIFYKEYLTSVWCFFAAGISVVIYWIVKESAKEYHPVHPKLIRILSDHLPWKNIRTGSKSH